MAKLQDKILKALYDIGYAGPLQDKNAFMTAVEGGPKNVEFTKLVNFITNEIRVLCSLDEEVNAIAAPEDSVAFIMEVTSFLKELNCPYSSLTTGHVSERLQNLNDRLLLLDYFITELMGARILQEKKPEKKIELKLQETTEAADMKQILMCLRFPKPPPNISVATLFQKLGPTIQLVKDKAGVDTIGEPLFSGTLSDKQWGALDDLQKDLNNEYKIRREMLLTRLDVTIQSFQWSDKTKGKDELFEKMYAGKRKMLKVEPDVDMSDVLAARVDLAVIEKTSSSSVRQNTRTSLNKVIIGQVPDRGGRTYEHAPPPPEMPSWQQRTAGPSGGGRGGRGGFSRGGGGGSFTRGGGGGSYNNRGGRGGGYQRGGGHDQSRGGSNQSYQSSYDSAGSYSIETRRYSGGSGSYDNNSGSGYNQGGGRYDSNSSYGGNNRSSYDNSSNYNRGGSQYQQSSGSSYGGGGGYNRGNDRRDSAGSYGKPDYEQTSKRPKTYDSFQSNKSTYADQYVQESQNNQQYHAKGGDNRHSRGGRGRSNYHRGGGGGNNYR